MQQRSQEPRDASAFRPYHCTHIPSTMPESSTLSPQGVYRSWCEEIAHGSSIVEVFDTHCSAASIPASKEETAVNNDAVKTLLALGQSTNESEEQPGSASDNPTVENTIKKNFEPLPINREEFDNMHLIYYSPHCKGNRHVDPNIGSNSLTSLAFYDCTLAEPVAMALSKGLSTNCSLTSLHLHQCSMGCIEENRFQIGANALGHVMLASNRWLTHLTLHRVAVGDEGAQAIAAGLLHGTTCADINGAVQQSANCAPPALQPLSQTQSHAACPTTPLSSPLRSLELSWCGVGDQGAIALAKCLSPVAHPTGRLELLNLSLVESSLFRCRIAHLPSPALSGSPIGCLGGRAIAAALREGVGGNGVYVEAEEGGEGDEDGSSAAGTGEGGQYDGEGSDSDSDSDSDSGGGGQSKSKKKRRVHLHSLTHLDLSDCPEVGKGAKLVQAATQRRNSAIGMVTTAVTVSATEELALLLQVSGSLRALHLHGCTVSNAARGAKAAEAAATGPIGGGGEKLMYALKSNSALESLSLGGTFTLTDGVVNHLCEGLRYNSTLRSLSLRGNELTDRFALNLVVGLAANQGLRKLDLSNNSIGEKGAAKLAQIVIEKNERARDEARSLRQELEQKQKQEKLQLQLEQDSVLLSQTSIHRSFSLTSMDTRTVNSRQRSRPKSVGRLPPLSLKTSTSMSSVTAIGESLAIGSKGMSVLEPLPATSAREGDSEKIEEPRQLELILKGNLADSIFDKIV